MEITALLLGQLLTLATLATGLRVHIHEDHTFRGLHIVIISILMPSANDK